jgi:hypothetical protein
LLLSSSTDLCPKQKCISQLPNMMSSPSYSFKPLTPDDLGLVEYLQIGDPLTPNDLGL